jgi:hypothetical protein
MGSLEKQKSKPKTKEVVLTPEEKEAAALLRDFAGFYNDGYAKYLPDFERAVEGFDDYTEEVALGAMKRLTLKAFMKEVSPLIRTNLKYLKKLNSVFVDMNECASELDALALKYPGLKKSKKYLEIVDRVDALIRLAHKKVDEDRARLEDVTEIMIESWPATNHSNLRTAYKAVRAIPLYVWKQVVPRKSKINKAARFLRHNAERAAGYSLIDSNGDW